MGNELNDGLGTLEINPDDLTEEQKASLAEAERLDKEDTSIVEDEEIIIVEDEVAEKVVEPKDGEAVIEDDDGLKLDWDVFEDEKHEHHKVAIALRNLYGNDPVRDEKHPAYQIVTDNQKSARDALSKTTELESQLATSKAETDSLRSILYDKDGNRLQVDLEQNIFGGMSYDEAAEEGKVPEWLAGRDAHSALKSQNEQRKKDREVSDKEFEGRKTKFFTDNPDTNQDEFLDRHSGHSFDQCKTLDTVKSIGDLDLDRIVKAGGMQKFVDGEIKTAIDKHAKALRKGGAYISEINNETGGSPTDTDNKFKLLSASEIRDLSSSDMEGFKNYVKRYRTLMASGKVPKSELLDEFTFD